MLQHASFKGYRLNLRTFWSSNVKNITFPTTRIVEGVCGRYSCNSTLDGSILQDFHMLHNFAVGLREIEVTIQHGIARFIRFIGVND